MSEKLHVYDKSDWAPGEWENEPDKEQFYHQGVPCLIVRNPLGALCGYAGVYPDHPWYEQDYDEVGVDVHGGLTYSDKCKGPICHTPKPGEPPVWWLGFDCAHYMDRVPYSPIGGTYKNIEYVREECKRLAEQIIAKGVTAEP